MFIAAAIVSSLLAVTLIASARGKLVRDEKVMAVMTKVGVPADKVWLLAAAELAAAVGLVVGLFWSPIGIAAAIGVIVYFLCAVVSHVRVHDERLEAAAILLLVGVAALILRAATTG
ncbi:MAG: hypothetical protein QOJ66_2076 [Ilumatobacteraceae bacterium]|jgi:hypothetical protein